MQNTQWQIFNNHTVGKSLNNLVKKKNLSIIAPSVPTFTGRGNDILDIIVTKNNPFNFDTQTINALSSDHLPVLTKLYFNSFSETNYEFNTNLIKLYEHLLCLKLDKIPINTHIQIENAISLLIKNINIAKEKS